MYQSYNIIYDTALFHYSDSKVYVDNMGPIWDRQDPSGPRVGPMNFAIWVYFNSSNEEKLCAVFYRPVIVNMFVALLV